MLWPGGRAGLELFTGGQPGIKPAGKSPLVSPLVSPYPRLLFLSTSFDAMNRCSGENSRRYVSNTAPTVPSAEEAAMKNMITI